MKIISRGIDTLVVSLTWDDFSSITGIDCHYDHQKFKIKDGNEFSTILFARSVYNAKLAWETKDKMKDLLKQCEKSLDNIFFPMQPVEEK